LPYPEECPKDKRGAIAMMLPPVTLELHETTYVRSGSTDYRLSAIFSPATIMAVENAPLVYAANNQPMPSEETWFYGGRWALLPPYSNWEVRGTPRPNTPTGIQLLAASWRDASCGV
jgi:hypothetical protein